MTGQALSQSDLLALVEVGARLGSEIQLTKLLDLILSSAGRLTDSPQGSVLLYDDRAEGLYFAAATGDHATEVLRAWGEASASRVPIRGSKAGSVFSTGKTIIQDSLKSDATHFKGVDRFTNRVTESMICVPLAIADPATTGPKRIGVIQILNKASGRYTARDRVLLQHLANYAAVAIRNARLFNELVAHMGLSSFEDPVHAASELSQPSHMERLTILSADMRGFTQVCNALDSPEEIGRLLSSLLTMLSDQVLAKDGIVNKMLGDGILAFFRGNQPPLRAVKSAFAIVNGFLGLRKQWKQDYNQDLSFLDIGIGIATGSAVLGTIGWGKARDFTAVGKVVNLAFALQSHARTAKDAKLPKRVLVDRATFSAVEQIVDRFEDLGAVELRKPDQERGVPYQQYHLISLVADGPGGSKQAAAVRSLRVFLCHASQDKPFVRDLYSKLRQDGYDPWLDEENLVPGQDWEHEIRKAVRKCDAVVVCLSKTSVTKEGFLQKEFRYVLDVAEEKPEGAIFIVPLKIEECPVPERLARLQSLSWSADAGYEKLKLALASRLRQLDRQAGEAVNRGTSGDAGRE
jgi:adenylate cyclase